MKDSDKTEDQIVNSELDKLRQQITGFERSITEFNQENEELKRSVKFHNKIFDSILDPFVILDSNYRIIRVNEEYSKMKNIPIQELIGRKCYEITQKRTSVCDNCIVEKTFRSGDPFAKEKQAIFTESPEVWVDIHTYPIYDDEGNISHVIEYVRDITMHKQLERELRSVSLTDELTGLYNRRGFFTLAEQQLKLANRYKIGIFMLYADIDNLKKINDTWGHREGDLALIETANLLKENYRESDIIARIGGDEFVVIPVGTSSDSVEIIIARFQKILDNYNKTINRIHKLSVSAGIALYDPVIPCSLDELLAQADKMMYGIKRAKT